MRRTESSVISYQDEQGGLGRRAVQWLEELGFVDGFLFVSCHPERREERNLKSVNGVRATISDSSLRCAAFRMTRGVEALRSE